MTTTYTKDQNAFLIDGEIYLTEQQEIKEGLFVKDSNDDIGKVISVKDIHNVEVEYIEGGKGLYCLKKECKDFDPLTVITHSTASLEGVTKLDRSVFVKPKSGLYTSEQLHEAMTTIFEMGRISANGEKEAQYYFTQAVSVVKDYLNTLSLPASITINNNEVTPNWE